MNMLFDPTKLIVNLNGTEAENAGTHGDFVCNALLWHGPIDARGGTEPISPDEQIKRWKLAMRIDGSLLPVKLNLDEAALIKKLVAKRNLPLVTGQICEALENPPSKKNQRVTKPFDGEAPGE